SHASAYWLLPPRTSKRSPWHLPKHQNPASPEVQPLCRPKSAKHSNQTYQPKTEPRQNDGVCQWSEPAPKRAFLLAPTLHARLTGGAENVIARLDLNHSCSIARWSCSPKLS